MESTIIMPDREALKARYLVHHRVKLVRLQCVE